MTSRPDSERLAERFRARFGASPDALARAPGRVNLIGEHTDYSGLPVLPMAIQLGTQVAARAAGSGRFVAFSESAGESVELGPSQAASVGFGAYLAGVRDELRAQGLDASAGAELYVAGDLPTGGGLSSSSALSVGLLTALDSLFGMELGAGRRLALAIAAERRVGVETGGMDQTVISFARAGHALRIDFRPPGRRQVRVPDALCFVVAYSGETAPKGGRVRGLYNARVIGCRAAAAWLGHALGAPAGEPPLLGALADHPALATALRELPERASLARVAAETGTSGETLARLTAARFDPAEELPLRDFAAHVLSEAARVDRAERALVDDLQELGELFDASHASLRVFGASTPALDALTRAMRGAGAAGARLTGAGFGGYALAVCSPDAEAAVLAAARRATGGPAFRVEPSAGASLEPL